MGSHARIERPTAPRDFTDHGACVEELAAEFARQEAVASEALIDSLVTQAIRQWRLDDATFWQRVKFHARLIRATRPGAAVPPIAVAVAATGEN